MADEAETERVTFTIANPRTVNSKSLYALVNYAVWRAATDTLDGPPEATRCDTLFPAAAGYWDKRGSLS